MKLKEFKNDIDDEISNLKQFANDPSIDIEDRVKLGWRISGLKNLKHFVTSYMSELPFYITGKNEDSDIVEYCHIYAKRMNDYSNESDDEDTNVYFRECRNIVVEVLQDIKGG